MISVAHFAVSDGEDGFDRRAQDALSALAARPGYLRGSLGRSPDEPGQWVMITEWENVGSYRRALGSYEVKLRASALLAEAGDLATSFESLFEVAPGGAVLARESDRGMHE